MSATNRGTVRDPKDFYPTPLKSFTPLIPYLKKAGRLYIHEPACGDGRLVRAMVAYGLDATGSDLFPQDHASPDPAICPEPVDFLKDDTHYPVIVTNPPFSVAFEFVQHAVAHADHVYMLLRLPFLASGDRKEWFQAHEPNALFVLSSRPSFVMSVKCAKKCGYTELLPINSERPKKCPTCGQKVTITTSDNSDYAWFYWGTHHTGIHHL